MYKYLCIYMANVKSESDIHVYLYDKLCFQDITDLVNQYFCQTKLLIPFHTDPHCSSFYRNRGGVASDS